MQNEKLVELKQGIKATLNQRYTLHPAGTLLVVMLNKAAAKITITVYITTASPEMLSSVHSLVHKNPSTVPYDGAL